jgi:oligoendopeptidase F
MKRPLIKKKSSEGDFMHYLAAFVPAKEYWIVFEGSRVMQDKLTEQQARDLSYMLNTSEYLGQRIEADQKKEALRSFDFEAIYDKYPRKIGKKAGIEKLRKSVKTQEKYNLLVGAVSYYADYCLKQNTEEKFIKHFSSWVSTWEDWIKEDQHLEPQQHLSIDDLSSIIQL